MPNRIIELSDQTNGVAAEPWQAEPRHPVPLDRPRPTERGVAV